jgi:bifunctional DNase/RNase
VQPPRPLTHDLTQNIVEELDATLTAVHVTHIDEGVFYASLIVRDSAEVTHTISARPSDAIALALRATANILASSELLDEIGIEIPAEGAPGDENQEVERFREFLDQINPEDFAG